MPAELIERRSGAKGGPALVFIHGFSGAAAGTWDGFMRLIDTTESLNGWAIFSVGYNTSMKPDIRGIWAGNPDLGRLSIYLRTVMSQEPMDKYGAVAFTAHSMGGLVIQRALVDDEELAIRTTHLTMFGTPSGGLRKAGWFRWFNTQARDMDDHGEFIPDLRLRWTENFGDAPPFQLAVVAGDRDEFVPASSSLEPFIDKLRAVVPGNHAEIVAPGDVQSLSYKVLRSALGDARTSMAPFDSAAVAVELCEFHRAVALLEPHAAELDDQHVVQLALALEGVGRSRDALTALEQRETLGTDSIGVLAGRLKRRWMAEGREADGARSLELYKNGLERALSAGDHEQAFYHSINAAFMTWAFGQDREASRALAQTAKSEAELVPEARWSVATQAEAMLYLGDQGRALDAYKSALTEQHTPREIQSMYRQAAWASHLGGDRSLSAAIDEMFLSKAD